MTPAAFLGIGSLAIVLTLGATGCAHDADVRVMAASSLGDAFDEIATAFEAQSGFDVTVVTAGSASLRSQLVQGAPADVVALADEATMADLVDAGVVDAAAPAVFATNHLVLIAPAGNPAAISSLDDLGGRLLAVCAPEVPCGRLALSLAEANGVTLHPTSEEQNVRAVLTKVSLGEVDAGLVYVSDVAIGVDVEVIADVPHAEELRNRYPIATITDDEPARAFVAFVVSPAGQSILAAHGFGAPS